MNHAHAIVLGGLGGLGGALVRELALRDCTVTVVDVLDPASAPHVHHKFRAQRLTALEGVKLLKLDLRSPKLLELLNAHPEAHLFHCANPNPTRPHTADSTLSAELTRELTQRIARQRHASGPPSSRFVIAQWTPLAEEYDPRQAHTAWEVQLENEELVHAFANELEDVIPVPLPMLTGPGMNPWLPPMLPAREIVSRIPARIPKEESTVDTLPLESAARWLADLALVDPATPMSGIEESGRTWPTPHRVLAEFAELAEVELEELRGEALPWGPPGEGNPSLSEGEAAQQQLAELIALPHTPEMQWPVSAKRRRKAKRRREER